MCTLPDSVTINGQADPQKRYRDLSGGATTPGWRVSGRFWRLSMLKHLSVPGGGLQWERPALFIGISDMKGMEKPAPFINDTPYQFR